MRISASKTPLLTFAWVLFGCCLCSCLAQPRPQPNNTVYEVFLRSFYDANGDGIGDLKGLTAKLDYLTDGKPETDSDLEIGILWLMPIFPAGAYHGYDVTDYENINPQYGSLDEFKTLLAECHKRGIRVILDMPLNHTSNKHPWFIQAVNNQNGLRPCYYIWPDDGYTADKWHTTVGSQGDKLKYFGLFGDNMPDLNFDCPLVRQKVQAVAKYWLDLGVDGFRLDAAKHIYGWSYDLTEGDILRNGDFWREFTLYVNGIKNNAVLVGEVLGDQYMLTRHARGLNALIDEPFMNDARAQIIKPGAGFVGRWKEFLNKAQALNLDKTYASFAYLASHDRNPRLASELEQKTPGQVDARYRLGMCMLMSMAKYPVLYNGDEVMQKGWKWNGNRPNDKDKTGDGSGVYDETLREPVPWYKSGQGPGQTNWQPPNQPGFLPKYHQPGDGASVEEQDVDGGMLRLVKALTNLRKKLPAFANGDLDRILTDSDEWMVFERVQASDRYLVLINLTTQGKDFAFHDQWHPEYRKAQLLFWNDAQDKKWQDLTGQPKPINDTVYVPPLGMVLLRKTAP